MSIFSKILPNDPPVLQRAILAQYVHNHSTSKFAVPIWCILIGLSFTQWTDWWKSLVWIVLCLTFTLMTFIVSRWYGDGTRIEPNQLWKWYVMIGVPRMLFVLTWSSMVFWAWTPEEPQTLFLIGAILTATMAMNAAQSGPVLPFYFLEMLPKLVAMFIVTIPGNDPFKHEMAFLVIAGAAFFTKIAFSINKATRTVLSQQYALAQAKEDVEQASRAKSSFLATMSHEVRTPLNGILGIIALLKDTPLNRTQDEFVETIRYSGETLLTMLNDILDFSKMEAGKLDLEEVSFDTSRLVHGVVNLMWSRAVEKNISLTYDIDKSVPPYITADPTRLRQVLLNFIGNAIKFTEKGGVKIVVKAKHQGAAALGQSVQVYFEIADTGVGIPPDSQKLLFKDFTQVDSTIMRKYGGTGLGLSICRRIVQLMNGEVGFKSVNGSGSTFWFEIPVVVAASDSTVNENDESKNIPLLEPLYILLAEDNVVNQKVAMGLLSKYGHKVDVVSNGKKRSKPCKRQITILF